MIFLQQCRHGHAGGQHNFYGTTRIYVSIYYHPFYISESRVSHSCSIGTVSSSIYKFTCTSVSHHKCGLQDLYVLEGVCTYSSNQYSTCTILSRCVCYYYINEDYHHALAFSHTFYYFPPCKCNMRKDIHGQFHNYNHPRYFYLHWQFST